MRGALPFVAFLATAACHESPPVIEPDAAVVVEDFGPFERIGHTDLDDEFQLNQGLAIYGNYAYTGHAYGGGITITDISNPAAPAFVARIHENTEMVELVASPERALLFAICNGCNQGTSVEAFDLSNPASPVMVGSFRFNTGLPHELYLWHTLLFVSDTTGSSVHVLDTADPAAMTKRFESTVARSHGISVSADGTRAYVSLLFNGLEIMDVSSITTSGATPVETHLTPVDRRLRDCTSTSSSCITHSAVPVPGRSLAVVTYENQDCPEGWMNIVDTTDPAVMAVVGQWRHPKYTLCGNDEPYLGMFGYGPHSPTVTEHLALVSWYRAGLLAFDLTDPTKPENIAAFAPAVPEPTQASRWGKIASVSYPIIRDGLIYILDGRNGLDILRYTGPFANELEVPFLTGNTL